jgi:hypothetical protein
MLTRARDLAATYGCARVERLAGAALSGYRRPPAIVVRGDRSRRSRRFLGSRAGRAAQQLRAKSMTLYSAFWPWYLPLTEATPTTRYVAL